MSSIGADELRALLPTNLTSAQVLLAEYLARTVCVAQVGPISPVDAGSTGPAFPKCRICFEPLAGELTLRHACHASTDDLNQPSDPPCGHTFHLLCLVEWANTNLHTRGNITCPSDRQVLISRENATRLRVQLNLPPPKRYAGVRPSPEDILPFWRNADPSDTDRPLATFQLATVPLDDILDLAGQGVDIGFIDWEVIGFFALSQRDRDLHRTYSNYLVPISNNVLNDLTNRINAEPVWQRAFPTCVYIQTARRYVDDHTNVEQGDYVFVPIMLSLGDDFRRRLLAITGPVPYVRFRDGRVDACLNDLDREQQLLQHRHAQAVAELNEQLEATDHGHAQSQSQPGQAHLHPVLGVPVFPHHPGSFSPEPTLYPRVPQATAGSSGPRSRMCITQ